MEYLYEMHMHTSAVSACGKATPREMARYYSALGFCGICVTEHFLNGNTTVPRDLSWAERIRLFCSGYETLQEEGAKLNLDVFFAWEYSYRGTDILTYGLDKAWLLSHPELLSLSLNDYCDLVRSCGALNVHAHPFREAGYIDMIRLFPRKVDAVEVFNACRTDFENDRAEEYAQAYGLIKIAGSDNHIGALPRFGALAFSEKQSSLKALCDAVFANEHKIVRIEKDG